MHSMQTIVMLVALQKTVLYRLSQLEAEWIKWPCMPGWVRVITTLLSLPADFCCKFHLRDHKWGKLCVSLRVCLTGAPTLISLLMLPADEHIHSPSSPYIPWCCWYESELLWELLWERMHFGTFDHIAFFFMSFPFTWIMAQLMCVCTHG